MSIRPLKYRSEELKLQSYPLQGRDGVELGLCRVFRDERPPTASVLVTHGLSASTDMFVVPEIRNFVDVLLDSGFEPWLLDWRGSCRLPYNDRGPSYTLDDVALHDLPAAVARVRELIDGRKLFFVAHCVGAISLSMSMVAGLVPGLSGVVAQGAFLTPKMSQTSRLRFGFLGEVVRQMTDRIPVDVREVGLWSKYTPLFMLASIGSECPDPTCQMLQNSAWGSGASLFVHDHIHPVTHSRLAELIGGAPTWIIPHLRKIELARAVVSWHEDDPRYRALPLNALDVADRIEVPLMLISGKQNGFWLDSNKLCHEVLTARHPRLSVEYAEVAKYGHLDAFIGRGAAVDFFPPILDWLNAQQARTLASHGERAQPDETERSVG